jgi:signal transduction histidine kinase
MAFRISARTVLALGSELISSDEVALYELVKNAIDAQSKTGVEIDFHISISYSAFSEIMRELDGAEARPLEELKQAFMSHAEATAEPDNIARIKNELATCTTPMALKETLPNLYANTNWIEIRDSGTGMSAEDIKTKYLVIGTPARKKEIQLAEKRFASRQGAEGSISKPPYLGEKGVGRLSAMRLGWMLHLESAITQDKALNKLDIDWRSFEDLDLYLQDVEIEPAVGGAKPNSTWSGTTIKISGLTGNWSPQRIRDVATTEFSKLSDPFSVGQRRFRIALFFNGDRIDIPRMERAILEASHATVKASYTIKDDSPTLDVYVTFKGPERKEDKHLHFAKVDLSGLTDDAYEEIPPYALRTVGPFEYEAYWYNRQKLRAIDSIGNQKAVRDLQDRWSGIMLFRDGYRVLPYGEDKDDWLGLDRRALASGGYKLSKAQFIGRVQISRLANPQLIDQTNREGLKETPEKYVFVELLRYITQNLLKNFMDDVVRSQKNVDIDVEQVGERITTLETRATEAIRRLKKRHGASSLELQDLQQMFDQMKEYFEQARALAEQAEDERARLIQLAGIGLMLEVIAHELARSTETAMKSLATAQTDNLPTNVAATLKVLRTEMQTMNKRLRVLDPLSVSGRQQRETFDLVALIRDIFSGRSRQFERHHIDANVRVKGGTNLAITAVKGMFVQIIENLTSNSVFWLKKRFEEDPSFSPRITVVVDAKLHVLTFSDNGPGISEALKEDVFKPFFSTKDRRRRQGLGLYIARECANYNESQLYLSDEHTEHETRLNTFVLELAKPNAR